MTTFFVAIFSLTLLVQSLLIYAQGPGHGGSKNPFLSPGDLRLKYEIEEELEAGTIVGQIPIRTGFTYRFNEQVPLFSINESTGEIVTTKVIDREALQVDTFDLVVLSSQPTYPIEIRIVVKDVNDHVPTFPEQRVSLSFSESATPGTRVFLDTADDPDSFINGITTNYFIISGNEDGHFDLSVSPNTSEDGAFLYLETTGKLDRETKSSYTLNISAQDNGHPPKIGWTLLEVKLSDVNDNQPVFDQSDYVISLNESVPFATHVIQVTAKDKDEGDNAKINYYLPQGETQFSVDPVSGDISTATHTLNCQQNCPPNQQSCPKSCVFTVFARDHGIPPQDGRTYVTVNLLETTDRDPIITFKYFPDTATAASVDENAQVGSVVAAISTLDNHSERFNGGDMVVEIIAGNDLKHFRLESSTLFQLIRVNAALDRESIGKYNLTIQATHKTSRRSTVAFLLIEVNDLNDHDPIFEQTEYAAVLRELIPIGSFVASITALDEDTGINAQLYYAIASGNDRDWFSMDPHSGLLTTKTLLDRETQDVARLRISARDGGPNPRWAYSEIKITILDENDQVPKFEQGNMNISLAETLPSGSFVATLKALDHDQGTNGSVSYLLSPQVESQFPGQFHLDPNSGTLVTKLSFDHEMISSYEIQVIAQDKGSPPLSSTATVFLQIRDANDNNPELYPRIYFLQILKTSPVSTFLCQISAHDEDQGQNAELTFGLLENYKNLFEIDPSSGRISLAGDFASGRKPYLTIKAFVTDGGGLRSRDEAIIHIFGVSDLEAEEVKTIEFVVTESVGKGDSEVKSIGKVVKNGERYEDVKYVIVNGDPTGTFRIDRDGTLFGDKVIDREATPNISLDVVVWNEVQMTFKKIRIEIQILDLNDNPPKFTRQGPVMVEIDEDAGIGSEVILMTAHDSDFGQNSTIMFSLKKNPLDAFEIDASSGLVTLRRILIDRISPSGCKEELLIEVEAQDGGNPPLKSLQSVLVRLLDVNNFTPVFDQPTVETSLLESVPVNSRFFTLRASDKDCGVNAILTFSIVDGTGQKKFGVLPDGNLYVKEGLDRELEDYYTLTVLVQDSGSPPRSSAIQVTIHVNDENDNSPVFTNETFIFTVMENEAVDTFVGKVMATDSDSGRNAELTYSFLTAQNLFRIESRTGFVRTGKVFEYEDLHHSIGKNSFSVEVVVTDGGIPPKTDTATIQIYIQNQNDNAPVFDKKSYTTTVSEGLSVGSPVLRVHATYASKDDFNGLIHYSLLGGLTPFKIDPAVGQISIWKVLDREAVGEWVLEVVAQDKGSLSSNTKVTVTVLDENDNAPEFTKIEPSIQILETTSVGKELIQFQATDRDHGQNQEVTMSVTGGNKHDMFRLDAKSGTLFLNKGLDFEKQSSYTLNITASDAGSPSLSTTIQFLVEILDFNDNRPLFPATAIFRQIPEGIAMNTTVVFVSAEDADSGDNGKVRYAIIEQEPTGYSFGIEPIEGRIFTRENIDREISDIFRLTISATDQALPISNRLSSEKLVTIIIGDLNDNEPRFTCMTAAILKKEDGLIGAKKFFRVSALDPDAESNGVVTFEIASGDTSLFSLDRNTGWLSLTSTIYNLQSRYQLTIRATDEAIKSQRKSADLYLTLIGVETESEGKGLTFTRPSYTGSIYENEPIGTPILHVKALVDNGVEGGEIEYYITNITGLKTRTKEDPLFEIDLHRGTIYTATVLDREAGAVELELEVYAILISSVRPRTASVKVEITILDRIDSPPKFKDSKKEVNISESTPVDSEIVTVVAWDEDTLGNVSYSIREGSGGKFEIEGESGVIRLTQPLDREEQHNFIIHVQASDGIQHSIIKIYIHILDENDNVPTFSNNGIYSFDIPEDAPIGLSVGKVEAVDLDQELNGAVTYSVASRWGNDVFALSPDTGLFTLINRLDYENIQHYVFVVEAQDSGVPSLSATATVYINLINLNDNPPVFDSLTYSREVYENISIGSTIVTVTATDLDSDFNSKMTYTIETGNEAGSFEITENGTIISKKSLDREIIAAYNLIIVASDQGLPPLTATTQVSIFLKDINDEMPVFVSPNKTSVMENSHVNTLVLVVNAVDRDEGRNGYVEYTLTNEKSTFSLGPVDGLLRVQSLIDREMRQNYTLRILAKDKGDPQRSSVQTLFVAVEDQNDNSPTFGSRQYTASIPENSSLGISVLEVSATDVDEGFNGQIRFSIVGGDSNGDFVIDEDTGVIRLARIIDYERVQTYVLTIRAQDCGIEPKSDTATALVSITNVNDNAPIFLDSPYVAHVVENMGDFPVPVIRLRAFDPDPNPNQQVRYLIKDGDKGTFRIDSSTGEITAHRKLDREHQKEYVLTALAIDAGSPRLTGTGTVRVNVVDLNDNPPVFEHRNYEFSVDANTSPGTNVSRLVASDPDEGFNGKIRYFFHGESPFVIDEETGEISTKSELKHQVIQQFGLIAEARDSSPIRPLHATVNVTLRIQNSRTESSIFQGFEGGNEFSVTIPDGSDADTFVFGLSPHDVGMSVGRRFYLSGTDADKFSINQKTGVVTTVRTLRSHPSTQTILQFEINGNDPLVKSSLSSVITLRVLLGNPKAFPQLTAKRTTFTLKENSENVSLVQVECSKCNPLQPLTYTIEGGNTDNSFQIDPVTGRVSVRRLDYESVKMFDLWIVGGRSDAKLKTSLRIHIDVTDENDNEPAFEKSRYELTVLEEEDAPVIIGSVLASDDDSESRGEVRYSFSPESKITYGHLFDIGSSSGQIITKVKLDREEVSHYELSVHGMDNGNPSLTGTTSVVITVEDANDNPPRFTRLFTVNVTENAALGTFVIQVQSVDKDIGGNSNCSYIFTEPNLQIPFGIERLSGNITVTGPLDREVQDEYLIRVGAIDGSWRAETLITISIEDLNDNAPQFRLANYSFNVREGQDNVTLVGQVMAIDRDKIGLNSSLTYALRTTSDFSIDPLSGEIFTKRRLTYKMTNRRDSPENEYELIAIATDRGNPPLSSHIPVTINILSANNSPPKFLNSAYDLAVLDTTHVGHNLIQILATNDEDVGFNAVIDYYFTSPSTHILIIDKTTGWVRLNSDLKGQRGRTFNFLVKGMDRGLPPLWMEVPLQVTVTGPNEHRPVFSSLSYRVIVPENEAKGSVIMTLRAQDDDTGPNGEILYHIIHSGNGSEKFRIDKKSGALSIESPLDYETQKEHHLIVVASDKGFHPQQTQVEVIVLVTDVNDNQPTFDLSTYTIDLTENMNPNTPIVQLRAWDKDSAKYGIITYAIVGGTGQPYFDLNSTTGQLSSRKSFDYEVQTEYTLDVVASNPDSNMFGMTYVTIRIVGVNEFVPSFVQPVFNFVVSESAPMGTVVGTVEATDKDKGIDGIINYLFLGSSIDRGFSINSKTGRVSVSRRLDRESQSRVILSVTAKNSGPIRGHDIGEAQIIITIQDGNDPPVFEKDLYTVEISEGIRPYAHVLTVYASDIDTRQSNSRFSYDILQGNDDGVFNIDGITGRIETGKKLDREEHGSYNLIVGAVDLGHPPQTGRATVIITLSDENDNPPVLRESSKQGAILENEPVGLNFMTLEVTDLDLPPNSGSPTFRLLNSTLMPSVKIEAKTGQVSSLVSFDREITPQFKIYVEINDNGIPPLKTVSEVIISVMDVNDNPSERRVVDLFLLIDKKELSSEAVGVLYPRDLDTTGNYKCRVDGGSESVQTYFYLQNDCQLFLKEIPTQSAYILTTISQDGRHKEVTSTTTIHVSMYDNTTVDNSVVLRIGGGTTPLQLMETFSKLRQFFSRVFLEPVQILGFIPFENGTDMILSGTSSRKSLVTMLGAQKKVVEETLEKPLVIDYSPCSENPCQNGAKTCTTNIKILQRRSIMDLPMTIFSSPGLKVEFLCTCAGEFEGSQCQYLKEPCKPNPCYGDEACIKLGYDFQCTCPLNRYGKRCEFEQVNPCIGKPCRNGGTCHPSYPNTDAPSYFCLCRPNFLGKNCSVSVMNPCLPNPCRNGGECSVRHDGFARCRCQNMFYGKYCEKSSIGFSEGSFMAFDSLDSNTNDISIMFSTNQEDSLLVYNFGEEVGGRSDFLVLELVKGQARLAFGGSRTAVGSVTLKKYVTDGRWYRILGIRNAKLVSLSISHCEENGDCIDCPPGDSTCYGTDIGHTGSLTFNGNPVYIGGLDTVNPLLERPGQIHTNDFVGCVQSFEINGNTLNMSSPLNSRGLSDKCHRSSSICTPERHNCGDGECLDRWDYHLCRCPNTNLLAPNCNQALSGYTVKEGGYIEFTLGEKYRRFQLLASVRRKHGRDKRNFGTEYISLDFRTTQQNGLLYFAATHNDYTYLQLLDGDLTFTTKLDQTYAINVTMDKLIIVTDGNWHTVRIERHNQVLRLYTDDQEWGEELNTVSGHNFLDPYLTRVAIGGLDAMDQFNFHLKLPSFVGCLSNFIITDNLIPLNGSGGLVEANRSHAVEVGCSTALSSSSTPDPLSIGVTLVIIFFTVLLVAILVSFVVFRLRKSEKGNSSSLSGRSRGDVSGKMSTSMTSNPTEVMRQNKMGDSRQGAMVRNVKKKNDAQGYQTPDIIIERNSLHSNNISSSVLGFNGVSMEPDISDLPEHYDLENASSIAPSDIDIVYHYKGYRESKSRGKSPPFGAHSHHFSLSNRSPELRRPSPLSTGLKSTPLARLSPSSELSQQTGPRILTLQDISGKPYINALLQKKEDMSQSSGGQSCARNKQQMKKKRRRGGGGGEDQSSNLSIGGLTAEEIERLNNSRQNNSSLISTLDVDSSSSQEKSSTSPGRDFITQNRNFVPGGTRQENSSSDQDEQSGNDSFTCSEFEFEGKRTSNYPHSTQPSHFSPKQELRKESGQVESFRGSLSTLVPSDDDMASYIPPFRKTNLPPNDTAYPTDTWNYLNNWNHQNCRAQDPPPTTQDHFPLPTHSTNNNVGSGNRTGSRYPNGRPTEEYV